MISIRCSSHKNVFSFRFSMLNSFQSNQQRRLRRTRDRYGIQSNELRKSIITVSNVILMLFHLHNKFVSI